MASNRPFTGKRQGLRGALRIRGKFLKVINNKVICLMDFDKAFEAIMEWEGGYVFDSNDPGGETKFGICKRSYPNLDIKNLTKQQAKEIYKMDYWDAVSADKLPDSIKLMVFDCAVNQGCPFAKITLQKALGVTRDGIIGPKTLAAFEDVSEYMLIKKITAYRLERYMALKHWSYYSKGWMKRLFDIVLKCAFLAKVELQNKK